MPAVTAPAHQKGDFLVDYEEKVFEDVKADTRREGARHLPHGRLRRLDRLRQHAASHPPAAQGLRDLGPALRTGRHARRAARLPETRRRGISRSSELQQHSWPSSWREGGKVYACRFALQALYGHGEPSLIPGIRPDQSARRARPHAAAPQGQRLHPPHLDALIRDVHEPAGDRMESKRWPRKRVVRAAAVQIAPDLDTPTETARSPRFSRAIAEAAEQGREARRVPRDLRALVSLLLLHPSARCSPAPSTSASTTTRSSCPAR